MPEIGEFREAVEEWAEDVQVEPVEDSDFPEDMPEYRAVGYLTEPFTVNVDAPTVGEQLPVPGNWHDVIRTFQPDGRVEVRAIDGSNFHAE